MATNESAPERRSRFGLVTQHGRALLEIIVVSGLGILASAGFQIVATRSLGPQGFGLLAAFLAVINIAAIGSAALRNSVAVRVAASPNAQFVKERGRHDPSLVEAVVLGVAFTAGLLFASPWLAGSLQSNPIALVLAAGTIIPYFLFARSLGYMQGVGDSRGVVWWSTGAQLAVLGLAIVALFLGFGAIGILAIYLGTIVVVTLGSSYQIRRMAMSPETRAFSRNGMVVVLLMISFAWLTNVDVILVRAGASELVAGSYAAATVLVKTTLILPATLSLYLLPRFVVSRANSALTRLGVNLTLAVTLAGGLAIFAVLVVASRPIVSLLFGDGYELTVDLLPWLAVSWLPWTLIQAILVRVTSISSQAGLGVLVAGIVAQWVGATLLLPDVYAMMALNGSIGVIVFVLLFSIHHVSARGTDASEPTEGVAP